MIDKQPSKLSEYLNEVGLLGWMATGVMAVLIIGAIRGNLSGNDAMDVAAFLLVLQRIVEAVQKRWENRSQDRMAQSLAQAPATQEGEK